MEKPSKQGLLDIRVELSTLSITAGNQFSLFVLVTNPFDSPVWVQNIEVSLPSELALSIGKDMQKKIAEKLKARDEEKIEQNNIQNRVIQILDEINSNVFNLLSSVKSNVKTLDTSNKKFSETKSSIDRIQSFANIEELITHLNLSNIGIDSIESQYKKLNKAIVDLFSQIEAIKTDTNQKTIINQKLDNLKDLIKELPYDTLIARKDLINKLLKAVEANQVKTIDSLIKLDSELETYSRVLSSNDLFLTGNENLLKIEKFYNELQLLLTSKNIQIGVEGVKNISILSNNSIQLKANRVDGNIEIYDTISYQEKFGEDRIIELKSSLPKGTALQAGSTVTYTTVLKVKQSLIFSPTKYKLIFNVNYSFDGSNEKMLPTGNETLFTNVIDKELSIRPSVYSVMFGASIGGFFGGIIRILQNNSDSPTGLTWAQHYFIPIFISVVLSGVATIFTARKSDVQSFVSIEDFWGGILIGFLVGYTGTSFFEDLTGINKINNSVPGNS